MDPSLLLSAGFGLGQGMLNYSSQRSANAQNYAIMKMQNEFNMNMLDQQYQNQIKLWQMNNSYNSPVKQMERLRSAGLNPSLLMGNNATAPASATSVPNAAPAAGAVMQPAMFNFSDVFRNVSDSLKSLAETRGQNVNNQYLDELNRSVIGQNVAYAAKMKEETKNNPVQRAYWQSVIDNNKLEYAFNNASFDVRYKGLELQNDMMNAQKGVLEEQKLNFAADTALKKSMEALNITENNYRAKLLSATIQELFSRMALNASQIDLNSKYGTNLLTDSLKNIAATKGLNLDNQQVEKIMPYVIRGAQLANVQSSLDIDTSHLQKQSIEKTIRQQGADFWNPFRYVGMVLGAPATAGVSGYMHNSNLGGAKRVVVKGFK